MSPAELQPYLYRHIPLSQAMKVRVESVSNESVVLTAPLAPNINHQATVFGGSASALAILSAWSLVRCRLLAEGLDAELVIQRNQVEYQRPINGTFRASSSWATPDQWDRFVRTLAKRGKGRVLVDAVLTQASEPVGAFSGAFVALR
ncbi:MAG: YiiD C-terminal domain-containing protein [Verrucomicrobiota bacterium JB023]|nr:YiiD C-terminal domain-containing protein [Verrucomicrobiota bacterium JB023]